MFIDPKMVKQVGIAMAMVSQFVGTIAFMVWIGIWIDTKFDTAPYAMLGGGMMGIFLATVLIVWKNQNHNKNK